MTAEYQKSCQIQGTLATLRTGVFTAARSANWHPRLTSPNLVSSSRTTTECVTILHDKPQPQKKFRTLVAAVPFAELKAKEFKNKVIDFFVRHACPLMPERHSTSRQSRRPVLLWCSWLPFSPVIDCRHLKMPAKKTGPIVTPPVRLK